MPRKTDSNNPGDWLWIASSDLAGVEILLTQEVAYEMARSKLAEILEKVLKAELLRLGWFLRRTHDLELLLDALIDKKSDLVTAAEPLCDSLSEAYFATRYPGFDMEDPNWPDLRTLASQIKTLLGTVQSRI